MNKLSFSVGVIAIVIGIFWAGQGLGYINWPASSFMIRQINWTYYGAALSIIGLFLIFFSRR